MTNHFTDFQNADVIIACGSNNAENHPASMRWVNEARSRGAKYIVVDPRFTRSAANADIYVPIRSGSDITFFGGLINYILQNDLWNHDYVTSFTNASWLITSDYSFTDGMFAGWDEETRSYDKKKWAYQIESESDWDTSATGAFSWVSAPGVPAFTTPKVKKIKKDLTLEDPQCVFQLMKQHFSRYTPEMVEAVCGMSQEQFLTIAETYGATGADDKVGTFLYAMGLTQHSKGSNNIRALSTAQLLLGNIGRAGGGVNALRGESNVQGSTDFGLLHDQLPAYIGLPNADKHANLAAYCETETPYAGYWSNKPKFLISMLKEWWGEHATVENDYCFDFLPKTDSKNRTHMSIFEDVNNGLITGLLLWGQNPAVGGPNSTFERKALEKLDWIVAVDLWETDTSIFWKAPGVDPATVNTEVFLLPAAAHYEKSGTVANSGRWIQWRYQAVEPRGEALDDGEILNRLYKAVRAEYEADPGVFADPVLQLNWDYDNEDGHFDATASARAINGYDIASGKRVDNFTKLKADGTTACGNWLYSGYYANNDSMDPADQGCGSRINEDAGVDGLEGGLGQYVKWAYAWPLNRRVLYNRASANSKGEPYDPAKPLVKWDGAKWLRNDVPDFAFKGADGTPIVPEKTVAFMMNVETVSRFFAPAMKDGPFPEHYEPYESPTINALSTTQNVPTAVVYEDSSKLGTAEDYPLVCTTFRLVEHWQTGGMTRNLPWLVQAMPKMFVEMSEELAAERGIENGDVIEVFNNRGSISVNAMVTKRLKPFTISGKTVHQVGMPWHWGFSSKLANGASANDLTPNVGDSNTSIPEFKAFLVDVRKAVS